MIVALWEVTVHIVKFGGSCAGSLKDDPETTVTFVALISVPVYGATETPDGVKDAPDTASVQAAVVFENMIDEYHDAIPAGNPDAVSSRRLRSDHDADWSASSWGALEKYTIHGVSVYE